LSQSKKKERGRRRRGEKILIMILTGKKPVELVQLDFDKQCVFKKSVLPGTVCG